MPATLERKFKNPCWYKDGKLICVPYYQILGVSKCGTTDLYHRLSQHPQVFKAANKGPHWWDECAYGKPCAPVPPDGDFASYTRLFDDAARSIETQDPNGITGEASSNTYTAAMGVYLRGASWGRNTNVTMPQLLWEASPWLRSIIIFRDPVERYTSAFYYYRHNKGNNQELHATAVRDIESWHRCVASHGTPWCVRHYNPQQLVKGMYAEFMDDWLKHFPREQLLILRYEDYTRAQVNHLDALFKFLGLNDLQELPEGKRSSITTMPVRNKNSDKYDKMLPETRKLMQEFYAPFNAKLASILKDDR
uniref:Sulfotransferase n=1 Tax=Dunaliella tertiolecta TaxID=3047 RepID=A0A7S3R6I9_DUNTE